MSRKIHHIANHEAIKVTKGARLLLLNIHTYKAVNITAFKLIRVERERERETASGADVCVFRCRERERGRSARRGKHTQTYLGSDKHTKQRVISLYMETK